MDCHPLKWVESVWLPWSAFPISESLTSCKFQHFGRCDSVADTHFKMRFSFSTLLTCYSTLSFLRQTAALSTPFNSSSEHDSTLVHDLKSRLNPRAVAIQANCVGTGLVAVGNALNEVRVIVSEASVLFYLCLLVAAPRRHRFTHDLNWHTANKSSSRYQIHFTTTTHYLANIRGGIWKGLFWSRSSFSSPEYCCLELGDKHEKYVLVSSMASHLWPDRFL